MKIDREQQLNYVLHHLNHHIDLDNIEVDKWRFSGATGADTCSQKILLPTSSLADLDLVVDSCTKDDPSNYYCIDTNNNLVFKHDFIACIFYLLSGYQEWNAQQTDNYGRFPFETSIQSRLGCIKKPVVNYLFKILMAGIRSFCNNNGILYKEHSMFSSPTLLVTHDIDLIDAYDINSTGYKAKELLGLASSSQSKGSQFKSFSKHLTKFLSPWKDNPFWNFDRLMEASEEFGFKSCFYFLPKNEKHVDSYYNLSETRINQVMNEIIARQHEVGIHGTVKSATSQQEMDRICKALIAETKHSKFGIRQHRLTFEMPKTWQIQEKAGIKYDATAGFAGHEGFRNSYCYPFHPYDFENNKMLDIWEIPLTAMDVTLFAYRNLNYDEIKESIQELIDECKKFNGVFCLLWHNNFFDEDKYPGIKAFYLSLLKQFKSNDFKGCTALELISRMV